MNNHSCYEETIDLILAKYCFVNKRSLETVYCRGILGVNLGLITYKRQMSDHFVSFTVFHILLRQSIQPHQAVRPRARSSSRWSAMTQNEVQCPWQHHTQMYTSATCNVQWQIFDKKLSFMNKKLMLAKLWRTRRRRSYTEPIEGSAIT